MSKFTSRQRQGNQLSVQYNTRPKLVSTSVSSLEPDFLEDNPVATSTTHDEGIERKEGEDDPVATPATHGEGIECSLVELGGQSVHEQLPCGRPHRAQEQKIYQVCAVEGTEEDQIDVQLIPVDDHIADEVEILRNETKCKQCCCREHCLVTNHKTKVWKQAMVFTNPFRMDTVLDFENEENFVTEETRDHTSDISTNRDMGDSLTEMIMNVNMGHHY